jgi:hypothetical protein
MVCPQKVISRSVSTFLNVSDIIEVRTYIPRPASHLKNCRFSSTRLSKEILVPNVFRAVTTIRWNRSISVRVVGDSGNELGSEGRTTS